MSITRREVKSSNQPYMVTIENPDQSQTQIKFFTQESRDAYADAMGLVGVRVVAKYVFMPDKRLWLLDV